MLTLLLVAACSREVPGVAQDVDAFVAASEATTLEAALASCESMGDAALADGCRLEAVRAHGVEDPGICLGFSNDLWRDDCFFLAAEAAVAAEEGASGQPDRICTRAGQFEPQCLGHVANARFRRLTRDCEHPATCMARDRALVEKTAARLADSGATVRSVWTDYFTQGIHRGPDLRLDLCDLATTEDDQRTCMMATIGHVSRQVVGWYDTTPDQRAQACATHGLPLDVARRLFDPADTGLMAASQMALRYACLPKNLRTVLVLGWNPRYDEAAFNRLVAARDPVACDALRFGPRVRTCRDTIQARTYQEVGAACAGASPHHPVRCMKDARAAVESAQALDADAAPGREWRAWYFQFLWQHLPLDRAPCKAARTRADRATCEDAVREAVTRITTYAVAGAGVQPEAHDALCVGGVEAVQRQYSLVSGADPGLRDDIQRGLDLGCPPDAAPRQWPWEPGYAPNP